MEYKECKHGTKVHETFLYSMIGLYCNKIVHNRHYVRLDFGLSPSKQSQTPPVRPLTRPLLLYQSTAVPHSLPTLYFIVILSGKPTEIGSGEVFQKGACLKNGDVGCAWNISP